MDMYKRPKPEESDEDLLAQQEEFFKQIKEKKIKLAAKIVSNKKDESLEENQSKTVENVGNDIKEQLANTFESIPNYLNIGRIIEKRKIEEAKTVKSFIANKTDQGFPKAKRRDMSIKGGSGSIFSQQMRKNALDSINTANIPSTSQEVSSPMDVDNSDNPPFSDHIGNLIKESKVLAETDKDQIHKDNLKFLKATPESEIIEERERLLSTLDPAIIAFLKARRKEMKPKSSNPSIHSQNEAGQNIDMESIKTTTELMENPDAEKWLNFDVLETHKLAWMKDITIPKIDKNKAFEARFDFEGVLLPFMETEMNEKNRILYHHGEEPERPGYTLQELFTLARSSVVQQKIIAMNSIANILSLHAAGVYQDILDIPIEQLFFLIRFCMDDNIPGVINASIKAMRCLIYNNIDEICLDCLLGFGKGNIVPLLPVDNEKEDDNTVNDQQLAERNLIRCLVRSGIYTRIRYIINTIKPSLETIVYCLEILIRLAKDSEFVLSEMYKSENLIPSIVKNFIPSTNMCYNAESPNETPVLQALKLVRILCCRSKKIANDFCVKYGIIDSISRYLQDETFALNANGMKLQIECFHLWRTLLGYNLQLDQFSILESILLKHLDYHIKHTNITPNITFVREGHCSAVLILLAKFLKLKPSSISRFENLIIDSLSKWSRQFSRLESFQCGKSQIISALISLCSDIYGYSKLAHLIDDSVLSLIKSPGFLMSTQNIRNCSMLLNNYEPHPFSANLKTLQTSAWYTADHVIPIVQTTSCFPFINVVSQFLSKTENLTVKINFVSHPNIKDYIISMESRKSHFLTSHWFTRIESELIMNILKISIDIQKNLDTSIFYALAVKSLCVFYEGQKDDVEYLLEKIIFCPSFYPSEALLNNLKLNERNENLAISLNNLGEIKRLYTEILGLKREPNNELNFCIDIGVGNVIPVDWIYTPIILMYSHQQQKTNPLFEEQQIIIVKNCLRWILIYDTYFPSLAEAINPTDRFCRLACVFLGNDGIFLIEEIHHLLELCLKNILRKFEDKLNFDKEILGLKNFQDFYNQMLEQYQGVSYGDTLFGNFVLVPLAQKQNVQWRKTLWSEYMGAVQILDIPKEKVLTKLDNYLQPPEEDKSLLNCYNLALSRGLVKPTSILHAIASHHCKEYLNRIRT